MSTYSGCALKGKRCLTPPPSWWLEYDLGVVGATLDSVERVVLGLAEQQDRRGLGPWCWHSSPGGLRTFYTRDETSFVEAAISGNPHPTPQNLGLTGPAVAH